MKSYKILDYLNIPVFDSKNPVHRDLSNLSQKCHAAAAAEDDNKLTKMESELGEVAGKLWGITDGVLRQIQAALLKAGD